MPDFIIIIISIICTIVAILTFRLYLDDKVRWYVPIIFLFIVCSNIGWLVISDINIKLPLKIEEYNVEYNKDMTYQYIIINGTFYNVNRMFGTILKHDDKVILEKYSGVYKFGIKHYMLNDNFKIKDGNIEK